MSTFFQDQQVLYRGLVSRLLYLIFYYLIYGGGQHHRHLAAQAARRV
jgi:hypothetical protein